jgi:hypothetical protein
MNILPLNPIARINAHVFQVIHDAVNVVTRVAQRVFRAYQNLAQNFVGVLLGRATIENFVQSYVNLIRVFAGGGQHLDHPNQQEIDPLLGTNVHAGDRDESTNIALQELIAQQGPLSQQDINQSYDQLLFYISNFPDAHTSELALDALVRPRTPGESFGPLVSGDPFTYLGFEIHGKELAARMYRFADSILDPRDKDNAKVGIVHALSQSFEGGERVCNQGKTQRLVTAVLQGRLQGVNVEGHDLGVITKQQAVQMFFHNPAHAALLERDDDARVELLAAANAFADINPNVQRAEFIAEINATADATW